MFGIFSRCDSVTEIVEGIDRLCWQTGSFWFVGSPAQESRQEKGDLKVHMLIDALQDVGKLVKVTAAKVHDSKFLNDLALNPHSMVDQYFFDCMPLNTIKPNSGKNRQHVNELLYLGSITA